MKTRASVFALLLFSSSYLLAAPPAVQQAQQRGEKRHQVAVLDRLMEAIHLDLKELKKDHPWLSEYTDECFDAEKCSSIVYSPQLPSRWKDVPPLPDFMLIEYIPIDLNPSENSVKDVPVCEFPSLKSKMFARIQILSAVDPKTANSVRSCVIKRCEALHKEMKREKAGNPQQNNGVSQRSRKRG